MAKKSPTRKRAAKSKSRKTTRKPARRTARKGKAPKAKASKRTAAKRGSAKRATAKRGAARRQQPKAAKKKVAARAAATRNRKPVSEKSTLELAASIARGAAATAVAAITQRLPWSTNENDPIALLETDHRRFEKLLEEGEKSTERAAKGRREIIEALGAELNVHEAIEEQILYPALEKHPEARKIALEGYEEHHVADSILEELKSVSTDDEKWGAKFKVLQENIEHHIKEEERIMFPAARGALKREELLALGARMRKLKADLER